MGTETKFGNGYAKNSSTPTNPPAAGSILNKANKAPIVSSLAQSSVQRSTYGCNGSIAHTVNARESSLNNASKAIASNYGPIEQNQIWTNNKVPFVPIQIDENNVVDGAKEILKVIRPHWDISAVQFKKFTDGITNKLVGCFKTHIDGDMSGRAPAQINGHGHWANGNGQVLIEDTTATATTTTTTTTTTTAIVAARNGSAAGRRRHDDNNDSGNLSDSADDDDEEGEEEEEEEGVAENAVAGDRDGERHDNVVLVRVYGNKTDLLIDRKAETRNILLLHTYGLAPSLYATFKNGLAYDYVPGVTLNTSSVQRPAVWQLVARRMAEMHRVVQANESSSSSSSSPPVPMLWHKTQSFFDLVPERFSSADKQKRLEGTFLPIVRLREEFESLYRRLEALDSPLVFSHNDLLLGNVIYTESRNTVTFIDYEYADYNFQAFDIGNHFAEFAGVDEVDYARYPPRDFQLSWLRVYLQAYEQRAHVDDADVERLYVQVNQFALAAHFFWTIWSLIQAEHSTIDFDYVDYAFVRYNEYLARRDEFLALDATRGPSS